MYERAVSQGWSLFGRGDRPVRLDSTEGALIVTSSRGVPGENRPQQMMYRESGRHEGLSVAGNSELQAMHSHVVEQQATQLLLGMTQTPLLENVDSMDVTRPSSEVQSSENVRIGNTEAPGLSIARNTREPTSSPSPSAAETVYRNIGATVSDSEVERPGTTSSPTPIPRARSQGTVRACPHCHKTFPRTSNLTRHILTVHRQERRHECDICHERFGQKAHLTRHFRKVHKVERHLPCMSCDAVFATEANFRVHVQAEHAADSSNQAGPSTRWN